ncbi:MAG TPA: ABC transporter permease [Vicinamibacteria bacterium]|nr:ABC transporter permease [Vicinamibacteria bacterium]
MTSRTRRRLLPAAAFSGLIALWAIVVALFDVPEYIVPSPFHVARTLEGDFGTIMRNLVPTAVESLLGFLLGNVSSIAVATVFVHQKTIEEAFFPLAIIIRSIPIVAIAPILVLLLGNDMTPKVVIAALICFFPTLVNMVRGLSSVNPQALELMRVLSATKAEIFWKLRIYNSLPYLFAALKIAASASVIGAIVGEWIGATEGIGALIIQATYNFDTGLLYASITAACVFSVLFTSLVSFLERRLVKWSPGEA